MRIVKISVQQPTQNWESTISTKNGYIGTQNPISIL